MNSNTHSPNEKHLDFIQNTITRMNTNSFLIKGACITITSALLALSISIKKLPLILIIMIPLTCFSLLDAVYLQLERKYRSLYLHAIDKDPLIKDYDLDINKNFIKTNPKNKYYRVYFSKTIGLFYMLLTIIAVLCSFIFWHFNNNQTHPHICHTQTTVQ
jgi:hypothetical protein